MTNIKVSLSVCLLLILIAIACKQELHEPISDDGTAPGPIKNPQVESLAGAAKISYTLPSDPKLLYVKAEYEVNGQKKEAKSSYYKNSVIVEGFGDTTERDVTLYSVSRSGKLSEPVTVRVKPLLPSVINVFRSLEVIEGFGGINVSYINSDKGNIVIGVLLWDTAAKEWTHIDNNYTSLEFGNFSVRGLPPIKRKFGLFIKDRWDNKSDTLELELTPIYEVELNKSKFVDIRKKFPIPQIAPLPKSGGAVLEPTNLSSWPFNLMFDGVATGNGFHTTEKKDQPIWIPIDLGVKAKLSRYKIWQRMGSFPFNHGNPHEWEIWGTNTPTDVTSWVRLDHQVMIKPSGLPAGQNSNDDIQIATNGQEYEFPFNVPAVRYIAWKHIDSWGAVEGATGHFHLMEMSIWGQQQ